MNLNELFRWRRVTNKTAIVTLSILVIALSGCNGGGGGGGGGESPILPVCIPPTDASLTVQNQNLAVARQVIVTQAAPTADAWVVVFEDAAGTPGAVLGQTLLDACVTDNVRVGLNRRGLNGEILHVRLHTDLGIVGVWEPGVDTPMLDSLSNEVANQLVATVAADSPDVRLTLSATGITDYRWTLIEPPNMEGVVTLNTNDPPMTLTLNFRYEIVNMVYGIHPFELLGGPSVLLSQSPLVFGSLEGDPEINWTDNGTGTMRFTADASLDAALTTYRCSTHALTMISSATVAP